MPRYSSGCRNCVTRRIRCDELRPSCRNCKETSLQCSGPRTGALFISENNKARQLSRKAKPQVATSTGVQTSESSGYTSPMRKLQSSEEAAHSHLCFLWKYWDDSVGSTLRSYSRSKWIVKCVSDPGEYPVAALALKALGSAFFGRRHRQHSVVNHAFQLRGQTLAMLRHVLEAQTISCNFDILAATTILRRWEYLMSTSYTGWRPHLQAISRIIEMSGAEWFQQESNKALLDENRFGITLEAYCERKRTFLERAEWKELRSCSGPEQALYLSLQDYYTDLAHLTEEITTLLHDRKESQQYSIERPMNKSDKLLTDLENWRDAWSLIFKVIPETVSETDDSRIYFDIHGPVFPSRLQYPSLQAATSLNFYRYLKLRALEWRHKLFHPFWWAKEDRQGMGEVPMVRQIAVDICRSLHVHFNDRDELEVKEIFLLSLTANAASKTFPDSSRESKWVSRILKTASERSSFEGPRNVIHMFDLKWRDAAQLNTI